MQENHCVILNKHNVMKVCNSKVTVKAACQKKSWERNRYKIV